MTLKEKLCEPFGGLKTETANELVKIAEDFAIGFAYWCDNEGRFWIGANTTKTLLEIYKKEKGL